jgi:hypothetical protein
MPTKKGHAVTLGAVEMGKESHHFILLHVRNNLEIKMAEMYRIESHPWNCYF